MKMTLHACLAAGLLAASAGADTFPGFTMDFSDIGEAGNAVDGTGYGAVSYGYRMGSFEVTEDQFVKSGVGDGDEGSLGANTPATRVSWHEAARFANWLTTGSATTGAYTISGGLVTGMMSRSDIVNDGGLFYVLPTVDEWYKAAYFDASGGGAGYSTYADGSATTPTAGSEVNYSGTIGSAWAVGTGFDEQNGTRDMMGNVWEWLESLPADNDPVERAISGGSYLTDGESLKNTGSRPGFSPATEGAQLGFRVVAIPEPGTLSLMSLSTISLFFTRMVRRRKAGRSLLPVRHEHFCDAYCSVGEWEASLVEEVEVTGCFDPVKEAVLPALQLLWSKVSGNYTKMDQVFWNHMVSTHESRTLSRKAFKNAFKQKTLACFDGFLALFMK